MGAKPPASKKLRNVGFKCEFCGRNVMTISSLRSHQNALHATALKDREKRGITTRSRNTNRPKVILKERPKSKAFGGKIRPVKMPLDKEKIPPKKEARAVTTESKESLPLRKIEFNCPKCIKVFSVYFSALKHIQKNHCFNSQGIKVTPEDLDMIKPIRTEICTSCNRKVDSDSLHQCTETSNNVDISHGMSYVCTGCNQKFNSIKLFDFHLPGLHSDGVENMFFPTSIEFLLWKEEMEQLTQCTYPLMAKYNSKQIYRCSESFNNDEHVTAHFCPSTIIFQEFTKGNQVHFYQQHSDHEHKHYVLTDKYKSYSITDMLQQASGYTDMTNIKSDENDLYLQFKTLMESIILDAAKINIDTLKVLIGKALDMTSILTNYDEDGDAVTENRSVLSLTKKKDDDHIEKALESFKTTQKGKRSVENEVTGQVKRLRRKSTMHIEEAKSPILQKTHAKSAKTPNSFSLADDKDMNKILKELDDGNVKKTKGVTKLNLQVNKNGVDNVHKVKIPESPPINAKKPLLDQSPSSFNDSYKDFVVKSYKKPEGQKRNIAKKPVVKTKIGQFKPNTSTSPTTKEVKEKRNSVGKMMDIEYEVQEQENDCNILILKI